jgi:hypothetical protein
MFQFHASASLDGNEPNLDIAALGFVVRGVPSKCHPTRRVPRGDGAPGGFTSIAASLVQAAADTSFEYAGLGILTADGVETEWPP